MTRQVWLKPNRRILWCAVLHAVAVFLLGGGLWLSVSSWTARVVGAVLVLASGAAVVVLARALRRPRLAYQDGRLLVYLRRDGPVRVPIDVVECFFLGQGPALPPSVGSDADRHATTSTVVVRLAESAHAWKQVDVIPALGIWCDGYITIRGMWCEPLSGDVLQTLNQRLVEAHREVAARNREASG